jgi:MSHA biogenesis protein MshO
MMRRPLARSFPRRHSGGFTLVEAILSIAIIGIVAGMVAIFIRVPILNYRDAVDRAELTDQADLALRRVARDIRLALPNSVRVNATNDHLELLLTRSGARYLAAEDGVTTVPVLSFDTKTATTFTAVGMPKTFDQVRVGDYVVVYNLGPGFEPANAYDLAATGVTQCPTTASAGAAGNIACINAVSAANTPAINGQDIPTRTITMAGNPFASQPVPMISPEMRFQVISGPVSFFCAAGPDGRPALWRAWNYAISSSQTIPPASASRALVATGLANCNNLFSYGSAASQRTGLVRIALELLGRADNPATVRLVHQVHVDNTP